MSDVQITIATLRSQGNEVTAIGAVMMALSIIAVGLRFIAKTINKQTIWHWDDIFITLALLAYVADQALILHAVEQGKRAIDATSPEWSNFSFLEYVYSLLYWTIIAFTTYSILLLYRNIFAIHRTFLVCSHLIAAIVTIWWISGTLLDARSYQPTEAFWNLSITGEYIINYNDFWIGEMVIELLFEAAILVLPVYQVAKLGLNSGKKILVTVIFAMGGFVLITGILRIHYVWKTADIIPGTIWLGVHGSVAIISACLPTYRPLLCRIPGLLPITRYGIPSPSTWPFRKKYSIEHTPRHDDTSTDSQSIEKTSLYQPNRPIDLQTLDLEIGKQHEFASFTMTQLHKASEDPLQADLATARARYE